MKVRNGIHPLDRPDPDGVSNPFTFLDDEEADITPLRRAELAASAAKHREIQAKREGDFAFLRLAALRRKRGAPLPEARSFVLEIRDIDRLNIARATRLEPAPKAGEDTSNAEVLGALVLLHLEEILRRIKVEGWDPVLKDAGLL